MVDEGGKLVRETQQTQLKGRETWKRRWEKVKEVMEEKKGQEREHRGEDVVTKYETWRRREAENTTFKSTNHFLSFVHLSYWWEAQLMQFKIIMVADLPPLNSWYCLNWIFLLVLSPRVGIRCCFIHFSKPQIHSNCICVKSCVARKARKQRRLESEF